MIEGARIADNIISRIKKKAIPEKELAAILVGENEASESFLRQKSRFASRLGIKFKLYRLSDDLDQKELEAEINEFSKSANMAGIILQIPIPSKYDRRLVIDKIDPSKDVDNLTGRAKVLAPAAGTVREILENLKVNLKESKAVVVGSGLLIGTPVTKYLAPLVKDIVVMKKNDFSEEKISQADILISGTGSPNLIKGDFIKNGAVVIDFGYGQVNGQVVGDVDVDSVVKKTEFFTPTPGGTGPILVAKLLENFVELNSSEN